MSLEAGVACSERRLTSSINNRLCAKCSDRRFTGSTNDSLCGKCSDGRLTGSTNDSLCASVVPEGSQVAHGSFKW